MSSSKSKNSLALDEIAKLAEQVTEKAEEKAKTNTNTSSEKIIMENTTSSNAVVEVKALEVRNNTKLKKKTTSFYLSEQLIDDIKKYTEKLNSNKSDVVEEILTNYFKEIRKQNLF